MSSSINFTTLFSVKGCISLVTGGGSEIGAYTAHGLAQGGCTRIYITERRLQALQKMASLHPSIVPIQGDVSTREGCIQIARGFVGHERPRGVPADSVQLDLLVNNAGVASVEGRSLPSAYTPWCYLSVVVKKKAALLTHLVRASSTNEGSREGRGTIINNASVSALYVGRAAQSHIYPASKAAPESITQNLEKVDASGRARQLHRPRECAFGDQRCKQPSDLYIEGQGDYTDRKVKE
ncbi:hypothetical protein EW146_g216 [Bondarzewia mesenterica]|uniref:Ketoreductase (KR) domain-containing protein n=1 Tax=Bondarzewia mesenterica TaxID=1095465 RepID=A0A4S4M9L0_9AGAM|nr:hypothetical protein EW146_g216 [Bondarzewia mesenterica]